MISCGFELCQECPEEETPQKQDCQRPSSGRASQDQTDGGEILPKNPGHNLRIHQPG